MHSTWRRLRKAGSSGRRDRPAVSPLQYEKSIVAAAQESFLDGSDEAYAAGIIAIALGTVLVFFAFPRRDEENELLRRYAHEDAAEPVE